MLCPAPFLEKQSIIDICLAFSGIHQSQEFNILNLVLHFADRDG